MKPVDIVLVGAGGYGALYARELLDNPSRARVAGVVEPYPDSCPYKDELLALGVPFFADLESFYAEHGADFAVISSPIQYHAEQCLTAMRKGSHVLIEKPVTADMAGVRAIEAARRETGKLCSVGYQWCYNEAMIALKRDIMRGVLGAPVSMRSVVLWPRDGAYYRRGSGWAGKRSDADGRPVMDSVVSNATAHYLMNILWLLGGTLDGAAELDVTRALTLRVNPIETFDTVWLSGRAAGARVLYIASHAIEPGKLYGPVFEYAFEKGCLRYDSASHPDALVVAMNDGTERRYEGMDEAAVTGPKLWNLVDAAMRGAERPCSVETAAAHTRVMDVVNAVPVEDLSAPGQHDEREGTRFLPGFDERLRAAYEEFVESPPGGQLWTPN